MEEQTNVSRRSFIATTGVAAAGTIALSSLPVSCAILDGKTKVAMVGTGSRGPSMWGAPVMKDYGDRFEFVGLCDINPGRVELAKKTIGVECPTYTDFELMMRETKPDLLIVTTVDATHDQFIIKGMEMGANILTEKPMTTDEVKCQAILDAEKKYNKKVTVTFNYRYSPHRAKMWELLRQGAIGELTSVDFHWYLDTSHGADYFRRWHRLRAKSGSLLLHKASHHFDLLNWWVDSDPTEVFASGALDFYGKQGPFRAENCRSCPNTQQCNFFWDITKSEQMMELYVKNEHYDGYLRDGCVFKEDIDIFDKMAATIKYASGVQVSYSCTTYSPYEGYRISFNGTKGRLDAWIEEKAPLIPKDYDELVLFPCFGEREFFKIPQGEGHAGGDVLLRDKIFLKKKEDPMCQAASTRDGALAILIGIAARKSIDSGDVIKIADLTDIVPAAQKVHAK